MVHFGAYHISVTIRNFMISHFLWATSWRINAGFLGKGVTIHFVVSKTKIVFFFPCFLPLKPALKLVDSVRKVRWLNNVEHMVIRGGFRSAEYTCFLFFEHHKLWSKSKLAGAVFVQNLTSAEKMIWLLSLVVSAVVLMTIWQQCMMTIVFIHSPVQ